MTDRRSRGAIRSASSLPVTRLIRKRTAAGPRWQRCRRSSCSVSLVAAAVTVAGLGTRPRRPTSPGLMRRRRFPTSPGASGSTSSSSWSPRSIILAVGLARRDRPRDARRPACAGRAAGGDLHRRVPRRADPAGGASGRIRAPGAAAARACRPSLFWLGVIALTFCPTAHTWRRCSGRASRRCTRASGRGARSLGLTHGAGDAPRGAARRRSAG